MVLKVQKQQSVSGLQLVSLNKSNLNIKRNTNFRQRPSRPHGRKKLITESFSLPTWGDLSNRYS